MKRLVLSMIVLSSLIFAYNKGDCVEFSIVGVGLLNSNKTIYIKGRVTGDAGSSSFVKIISMTGGNKFYHGGKYYYQGDEIEVPNGNLDSCN